ncbi:MAG TPA: hypothetical protein VJ742_05620 [Nitrososphaera sp.]|nr:hypothetical protein [Nitrososphaera sp.]
MTKTPQWKLLYQAMQKGKRLTMLDIFKLTGSLNGHKRIDDIEKHLDTYVYKGWRKVGSKRYREYSMK